MRPSTPLSVGGLALAGIVIASVAVISATGGDTSVADRIALASVKRGTVASYVSAAGNTIDTGVRDLAFGAEGTVEKVYVKVGQKVRRGKVLAQIDDTIAKENYEAAKAALAAAQETLDDVENGTATTGVGAASGAGAPGPGRSAAEPAREARAGPGPRRRNGWRSRSRKLRQSRSRSRSGKRGRLRARIGERGRGWSGSGSGERGRLRVRDVHRRRWPGRVSDPFRPAFRAGDHTPLLAALVTVFRDRPAFEPACRRGGEHGRERGEHGRERERGEHGRERERGEHGRERERGEHRPGGVPGW
ncbi:hypothetical protein GCM10027612_84960 [Microbispora bryophytorum subsp. camponoti]